MKQNINILIMIGVLVLACGKLQGVTREQFSEVVEQIHTELAKSPNRYQEVDFSKAFAFIDKVHRTIPNEQNPHEKKILKNMALELEKTLANAVFTNLTKLAGPITEEVYEIIQYIKVIEQTSTPFTLDNSYIKNPITNEINPRLDSAFQEGLLSNPSFIPAVEKPVWEKASNAAMAITTHVINLLDKLTTYIQQLNKISKTKKMEKPADDFTKDNFDKTAQTILTMKWVADNLYSKLKYIFPKKMILIPDLTSIIGRRDEIFSELKYDLYRIYEVRETLFSLISIKSYFWPLKDIYYSYPQDDPLVEIPPSVAQIKSERLKQPPVEKPSEIRKLRTKAATIEEARKAAIAIEETRRAAIAIEETRRAAIAIEETRRAAIAIEEARRAAIAIEEARRAAIAIEEVRRAAAAIEEARKEGITIEETKKEIVEKATIEVEKAAIEKEETKTRKSAIGEEAIRIIKAAIEKKRRRRRKRKAIEEEETAAIEEEETAAIEEKETAAIEEEETAAIEEEETAVIEEEETAAIEEEETAAEEKETAAEEKETAAEEKETAAEEKETAAEEKETEAEEKETEAAKLKKQLETAEAAIEKEKAKTAKLEKQLETAKAAIKGKKEIATKQKLEAAETTIEEKKETVTKQKLEATETTIEKEKTAERKKLEISK